MPVAKTVPGYYRRAKRDLSLVFYTPLYKKDGSSFISDDAYGHVCTVTGATKVLQGRLFAGGDDYINCGNNSALNFTTTNFTIIVRAYLTATDAYLFGRRLAATNGYSLDVQDLGGGNSALTLTTSNGAGNQASYATLANTAVLNAWHLFGCTRVGAVGKVFLDNVDVTSTSATHQDPVTSTENAYIGIYRDLISEPVYGTINELWVFSRALSIEEMGRYV